MPPSVPEATRSGYCWILRPRHCHVEQPALFATKSMTKRASTATLTGSKPRPTPALPVTTAVQRAPRRQAGGGHAEEHADCRAALERQEPRFSAVEGVSRLLNLIRIAADPIVKFLQTSAAASCQRRQGIVHARRHRGEHSARYDSVPFKRPERQCQHPLRNAVRSHASTH